MPAGNIFRTFPDSNFHCEPFLSGHFENEMLWIKKARFIIKPLGLKKTYLIGFWCHTVTTCNSLMSAKVLISSLFIFRPPACKHFLSLTVCARNLKSCRYISFTKYIKPTGFPINRLTTMTVQAIYELVWWTKV